MTTDLTVSILNATLRSVPRKWIDRSQMFGTAAWSYIDMNLLQEPNRDILLMSVIKNTLIAPYFTLLVFAYKSSIFPHHPMTLFYQNALRSVQWRIVNDAIAQNA